MEGKLAVVFVEDTYECLELHYPRLRLQEAGFNVLVVGPQRDTVYKSKEGYWARSTSTVADVDPASVSVVIIPGGYCADRLRRYRDICSWLAHANAASATIGVICHGGWLAVSANILKGKRGTCFFAIKDDLVNAGMEYVDARVVTDGNLVTAQTPDDLPSFMASILAIAARM